MNNNTGQLVCRQQTYVCNTLINIIYIWHTIVLFEVHIMSIYIFVNLFIFFTESRDTLYKLPMTYVIYFL